MNRWFLQGSFNAANSMQEIPLNPLPQILGRDEQLTCSVTGATVSRNHARVDQHGQQLLLTDLGSSNGTFVNRQRIVAPTLIDHGDIIHLGTIELRLINRGTGKPSVPDTNNATRIMGQAKLSDRFPPGIKELEELIHTCAINMVYQPIIRASDLSCIGYEALCRGASARLPTSPLELFRIAESFSLETPLSEMLRAQAVLVAEKYRLQGDLFINTHPSELQNPDRLIGGLVELRKLHPNTGIVLEIHEHAMTDDSNLLSRLKQELTKLNIKLAFDDFGVGQSRLMEMIEAQPNIIKFDKKLVENIDTADVARIQLVESLLRFAKDLKIETLAECVATEAEYKTCKGMGFEYYQGYYFEKPKAPEFFQQPQLKF
jgi:EAL domain-containing protein (putative c-di-GMP-specific phosphodiesterase class I)